MSNQAPRISVNKLGEYLISASPSRRRSIISDQKNGNAAAVPLYRNAYPPIESFLVSSGFNTDAINNAIETLRSSDEGSEWTVRDNRNTTDALECFLDIADGLTDDDLTFVRGEEQPPKLTIEGVQVSVRPDFLIFYERRNRSCVGALKIHFTKDDDRALTQEGGEYVGVLLHQWLQEFGPKESFPDHTRCLVVDCFRKRTMRAPASFQRRIQNIRIACGEIAMLWRNI